MKEGCLQFDFVASHMSFFATSNAPWGINAVVIIDLSLELFVLGAAILGYFILSLQQPMYSRADDKRENWNCRFHIMRSTPSYCYEALICFLFAARQRQFDLKDSGMAMSFEQNNAGNGPVLVHEAS